MMALGQCLHLLHQPLLLNMLCNYQVFKDMLLTGNAKIISFSYIFLLPL